MAGSQLGSCASSGYYPQGTTLRVLSSGYYPQGTTLRVLSSGYPQGAPAGLAWAVPGWAGQLRTPRKRLALLALLTTASVCLGCSIRVRYVHDTCTSEPPASKRKSLIDCTPPWAPRHPLTVQAVAPACPAGGLLVADYRTMHRGLANGGRERLIAYVVLGIGEGAEDLSNFSPTPIRETSPRVLEQLPFWSDWE